MTNKIHYACICMLALSSAMLYANAKPQQVPPRLVSQKEVPARDTYSIEQLEQLAKQGDAQALVELGLRYSKGIGVKKNLSKAIPFLMQGAEKGNAIAQQRLGFFYSEGIGLTKNAKKAFFWTEKAAQLGDARAMFNLGIDYSEGQGVSKNAEKAFFWTEKAAKQGHAKAKEQLKLLKASPTPQA